MILLLLLCISTQSAFAKQKTKVFLVKGRDIAPYRLAISGFRRYVPINWDIVECNMEGATGNTYMMISSLEKENPDLVIAVGAKALAALTRSKVSHPIVFCMVMNSAAYDLRALDITGVSLATYVGQQMSVLISLCPNAKKIGVMMRRQTSQDLLKQVKSLAKIYGKEIVPVEFESEKEIPRKLRAVLDKVDALWMLDDSFIHSKETLEFVILSSLENDLPFMANSEVFVREGALVSLSPSFFDNGRQAADMAKKILQQKQSPRNIPISLHKDPDIILNLKIARKIHLYVPPEFLDKANKVYR